MGNAGGDDTGGGNTHYKTNTDGKNIDKKDVGIRNAGKNNTGGGTLDLGETPTEKTLIEEMLA